MPAGWAVAPVNSSERLVNSPARPVMVSFCTHFLHRDRWHVYRQVVGIRAFENWVMTRTRLNAPAFPYERIVVLRRSPVRVFARLWRKMRRRRPVPLDRYEVQQILRFARERRVELIHTYFGTEAAGLFAYYEREPCAKVVSFHGADVTERALPSEMLERLVRDVDLLLCRSRSLREALVQRGCPVSRIRLNHTGVPVPEQVPSREAPRPGPDQPLRLLQACRFVEKKGLDVSIRAVGLLRARGTVATLTLAGDGPQEGALRALTADLRLSSHVRFAGFLGAAALSDEMRDHDLFLQPSRTTASGDMEGIPNAMLEAMGHGLPVIATSHGGIPEAIVDERIGLLLPEADPDALAAAVTRLLDDPGLYRRLAAGGRETVKTEFSEATCVRDLEETYREAIRIAAARRREGRITHP